MAKPQVRKRNGNPPAKTQRQQLRREEREADRGITLPRKSLPENVRVELQWRSRFRNFLSRRKPAQKEAEDGG